MKKCAIILLALALVGCKCKKDIAQNEARNNATPLEKIPCPDKGICKTELLKNKSLSIVLDDFGKKYYKLVDSRETHVVRYEYTRGNEDTMPDSGYREEIIFEIGSAGQEFTFKDAELQQTLMLYGRFCFCPKEHVGYFPVNIGTLTVSGNQDIRVSLDFAVPDIPQVTKQIRADLK